MRHILTIFSMMMIFFLAACQGADTATQAPASADEPLDAEVEEGFVATVSGAVEATIAGSGSFQCEDIDDGELNIYANFGFSNTVIITLPRGIEPGSYDLNTPSDMEIVVSAVFYPEEISDGAYEENVSGTIELSNIPEATGDPTTGSFSFTAENAEGASVSVEGEFDFIAGENAYVNCP